MVISWNVLDFKHECGANGIIQQIFTSQDGGIKINGVCAICIRDFEIETTMTECIAENAIDDYRRHCAETPEEQLLNFVEEGNPT